MVKFTLGGYISWQSLMYGPLGWLQFPQRRRRVKWEDTSYVAASKDRHPLLIYWVDEEGERDMAIVGGVCSGRRYERVRCGDVDIRCRIIHRHALHGMHV